MWKTETLTKIMIWWKWPLGGACFLPVISWSSQRLWKPFPCQNGSHCYERSLLCYIHALLYSVGRQPVIIALFCSRHFKPPENIVIDFDSIERNGESYSATQWRHTSCEAMDDVIWGHGWPPTRTSLTSCCRWRFPSHRPAHWHHGKNTINCRNYINRAALEVDFCLPF